MAYSKDAGMDYLSHHLCAVIKTVNRNFETPQSRASCNRPKPLEVKISLAVNRVVSLDDVNGELVADGVLSMQWIDDRIAWNAFYGVDTVVWKDPGAFWTPDVLVLNGFGSEFDTSPEASALHLNVAGNVTWRRRLRMRVPYDAASKRSDVMLASWSHASSKVTLRAADQGVDLSDFQTSGSRGYTLTSGAVTKSTKTSSCMTSGVDVITFTLSVDLSLCVL